MDTLTIGSRRSRLARAQAQIIRQKLLALWADLEVNIELIDTRGDLNRRDPLPTIGGKGLFTQELEAALRQRRIDLAVHSLKDLPIEDSAGLTIAAVPERAAPNDLLISRLASSLDTLPPQAVVGTSSLRRAAQILALRPDIHIKDIRGNVDTRLGKVADPAQGYDAILLAQAGLDRLGLSDIDHAYPIPTTVMLPAPGQGALAVQGRVDDQRTSRYLESLDDTDTRAATTAERAFLAALGSGCSLPVAALAKVRANRLDLQGLVASDDGRRVIRVSTAGPAAAAQSLGQLLAEKAQDQGAARLLSDRVRWSTRVDP